MISSLKKRSKQESEELNMAAQAERLKISITEENRAIRALQEREEKKENKERPGKCL